MASCFREAGDEVLEDDFELGRHELRSMIEAKFWEWVEGRGRCVEGGERRSRRRMERRVRSQGEKLLVEEGR